MADGKARFFLSLSNGTTYSGAPDAHLYRRAVVSMRAPEFGIFNSELQLASDIIMGRGVSSCCKSYFSGLHTMSATSHDQTSPLKIINTLIPVCGA